MIFIKMIDFVYINQQLKEVKNNQKFKDKNQSKIIIYYLLDLNNLKNYKNN